MFPANAYVIRLATRQDEAALRGAPGRPHAADAPLALPDRRAPHPHGDPLLASFQAIRPRADARVALSV